MMPRFLYLMRHAQSADKQPGQPDKERELTTQGMRDALSVGTSLLRQKKIPEIILASTATRAKHTASLVTDATRMDTEKIQLEEEVYTASVRTFLRMINETDDEYGCVMYVGHNPVISYLAEYLTTAEIGDLQPAALAIIQCNVMHWKDVNQGNCELVTVLLPDQSEI